MEITTTSKKPIHSSAKSCTALPGPLWTTVIISGSRALRKSARHVEKINSFEKALQWMAEEEPQAAAQFQMHRDKLMDF